MYGKLLKSFYCKMEGKKGSRESKDEITLPIALKNMGNVAL